MKETCSCGAKFEYVRVEGMTIQDDRLERVYEMLLDWRVNHRHEPPALHSDDAPQVVDVSGAHIEKAVPFGFTREPLGGWGE